MKFAYLIEPPFNYQDEHDRVTGCDVELAKHIFSKIGTDSFEPIETEFANLLPGVVKGDWRMTTGLFATPERKKIVSFSRPIWALPDGLLVNKDNPLSLKGYRSVAAIPECTLAVIRDQFQHLSAVKFGVPDERILIFETYTEAAKAVKQGKADAYASVGRAHTGFIEQNSEMNLEHVPIPVSEKQPAFGCFAVAKSDNAFRHCINEVLDAYIGSKQHRTLMAEFGFTNSEIDLLIH